jgi:hypothetical protein
MATVIKYIQRGGKGIVICFARKLAIYPNISKEIKLTKGEMNTSKSSENQTR